MSENYIVINGKRLELTPEQLAALGVKNPKESKRSPFERANYGTYYYYIDHGSEVECEVDLRSNYDDCIYAAANYCTDQAIIEQRALHEILNRRLWRYSMEHGGDKIDWNSPVDKFSIYLYYPTKQIFTGCVSICKYVGEPYFLTDDIAKVAIKEIVEPFIAEHPEFVW